MAWKFYMWCIYVSNIILEVFIVFQIVLNFKETLKLKLLVFPVNKLVFCNFEFDRRKEHLYDARSAP